MKNSHSSHSRKFPTPVRTPRPSRRRLALEYLEDRTLLSAITVTTFDDTVDPLDGVTSLREAVSLAASLAGEDTIHVPRVIDDTTNLYRLSLGEIAINDVSGKLTIQGDVGPTAIFAAAGSRHFTIGDNSEVELSSIGLGYGEADYGGAIRNRGNLTLRGSAIYESQATAWGGGIFNSGTLTMISTDVSNNRANARGGGLFNSGTVQIFVCGIQWNTAGDGLGGGVDHNSGSLTVSDSYIAHNTAATGGGINADAATTIESSTFTGNLADTGGGLVLGVYEVATLSYCTFTANAAQLQGGGVYNNAATSITDTTFEENTADGDGGGYFNSHYGATTFLNGAFQENQAGANGGGILSGGGSVAMTNVPMTGNSAGVDGGAIFTHGDLTITGGTLTGNSAVGKGGALGISSATVTISETTFTDNAADSFGGAITSLYGSLTIEDADFGGNTANYGGSAISNENGTATISDTTIHDNTTLLAGYGTISNYGTMTILSSDLTHNAVPDGRGGALYHGDGSLTIEASNIAANSADYGGGVAQYGGTVTIRDSNILANSSTGYGGGIYSFGSLMIEASDIVGNSAAGFGGGVYGSATITDSTIAENTAERGGGVFSPGTTTITASTIRDNEATTLGGGVNQDSSGSLTITDSTLSGNLAVQGGGLYSFGLVTILTSTISTNAAELGGGIRSDSSAPMTLISSTIAGNSADTGGGLLMFSPPTIIANTIVAGNLDLSGWPDAYGEFTSQGYNLIGIASSGSVFGAAGDQVGTAASPIDPRLGPLQDNGGPTFTHALLLGSPALDAGDPARDGTTDQRGVGRPQGGRIDIGAFESDLQTDAGAEAPLLTVADASGPENGPIAILIVASLSDTDGSETLSITIGGVPADATLSAGTDLGGGQWGLTPAQLVGLTITVPENQPLDASIPLTVTATSTETAGGDTAATTATLTVQVLNVAPAASVIGPASGVVGQVLTFTIDAADPSADDQAAGFSYSIDWGDGSDLQTIDRVVGATTASHAFLTDGSTTVRVRAIDRDGGEGDAAILVLAIAPVTPSSLQDAVDEAQATGGEVTILPTSDAQVSEAIQAINLVEPPVAGTPVTVTFDLGGGTYHTESAIQTQPGVTLVIQNGTLVGGSPALIVSAGLVILDGVTAVNATDAPTILVTGGSLIVRNSRIEESTGFAQAAILVTGGTVDLGTEADHGGNSVNVNGDGKLVRNSSGTPVSAVGATFTIGGEALTPSSLSGIVFEDFNADGEVDFGEQGLVGVTITLVGTDFLGNPVQATRSTDDDGAYIFGGLLPGAYTVLESQPAGFSQGINTVGTACGTVTLDQFDLYLAAGLDAMNYNYGERPSATGSIAPGQTAGIGFWNNKNGQALIKDLNGGAASTQLGNWLAATLPNMFGSSSGSNDLAGMSNADVAAFFQSRFVLKGEKLDAQVLATALAVYVTNETLNSTGAGARYGFVIAGTGLGTAAFNVGTNGEAFGVANNATMTVMDLLLAVDTQTIDGLLYNGNTSRRSKANKVFAAINQAGQIS